MHHWVLAMTFISLCATVSIDKPETTASSSQTGRRVGRQGPKMWDQWSDWSGCSVTCGVGKLSRWRHCIAGGCSQGEKEQQLKTCTFPACLYEDGQPKIWDQWGKWSCCSASCGPGKVSRWRHCVAGGCAPGEKEAQIKQCYLSECDYPQ
ncbi:thrombospondin-2 isoform X1 [Fopius arisanus]|uniref:BAI2 protein n=2 Tax=Fopius arisanus TaxID=64838 RepID=A0A0C9RNZ8_9HYME|nr:PREDICTED: thrombospondin-2-like isoform X1 [Fopius arisanus]